jgi:hypothetical protein
MFYVDFPDDPSVPAYMRGPRMTTLLGAVGAQLDALQEQVLVGRLQANPYAGGPTLDRSGAARLADGRLIECEEFVLPIHAQQRGIRLFPTESTLSKRIRVSSHLLLKQQRGTHLGEIRYTRPYFAPDSTAAFAPLAYPHFAVAFQTNEATPRSVWIEMDSAGNCFHRVSSPSNFDIDGRPSLRTRYGVFVDMSATGYSAPWTYDSGHTYDSGGMYDVGDAPAFTGAQMADVAAMLADWKSAHSWLQWVIFWWPMTGGAPFPTWNATPTQDATGWWSLPNGANTWSGLVDPATGLGTRPPNMVWIFDNPAP